jgi:hypothetical protein
MQLRGMRSNFENELATDWDGGGSGEDDEDDEIDLSESYHRLTGRSVSTDKPTPFPGLYVDPDDLCPVSERRWDTCDPC